jgi:hypothetical protein
VEFLVMIRMMMLGCLRRLMGGFWALKTMLFSNPMKMKIVKMMVGLTNWWGSS